MRCAFIILVGLMGTGLLLCPPPALAEGGTTIPPNSDVAVVLSFEGASSHRSVEEMKRETESIFRGSGVRLDWKSAVEAQSASFEDLVVVRFKGACVLDPGEFVPQYDESGPIAHATVDGDSTMPFAEVACDKVERVVRPVLAPSDYTRADQLMGRAMGRVLAHELVHILTKSISHGSSGVARSELSGKQLIAASLPLDPADRRRLLAGRLLTGKSAIQSGLAADSLPAK